MAFRHRTALARLAATAATCLLFLGTPHAAKAGPPPTTASAADKKTAQQKYDAGVKQFKLRRFKEALAAFKSSYDVVASPATHLMIGKTLRELGQLVEAFDELDQAEYEAQQLAASEARYSAIADSAGKEREIVRPHVAVVNIKLKGADSVSSLTVAGKPVPPSVVGRALAVNPGPVDIVAVTADGKRAEKQAQAAVGGSVDVELETGASDAATPVATAPPPPPPPSPPPETSTHASLLPYAAIAGGIGLVGVGVFAAFGIMSKNKYDSLSSSCAPNCSQDDLDIGKKEQTIANVGLVVGAVGVATGVALFAIDRSRAGSKSTHTSGTRGLTNARLLVGPRAVTVQGGFW